MQNVFGICGCVVSVDHCVLCMNVSVCMHMGGYVWYVLYVCICIVYYMLCVYMYECGLQGGMCVFVMCGMHVYMLVYMWCECCVYEEGACGG